MASQTQGIQQLLAAEKRAAEKVSEARKRKNRRLKQAKEEAQAEIEKYKGERDRQFKDHEARNVGSKGDIAARIEADTKQKVCVCGGGRRRSKKCGMNLTVDYVYNLTDCQHERMCEGQQAQGDRVSDLRHLRHQATSPRQLQRVEQASHRSVD